MAELPSLSIVTACFNAADTLPETLQSVASQRGVAVEHWVLDGGSGDATRGLLESADHPGLQWASERDAGVYDALNNGFARANGEVLGLLHADDVFADEHVLHKVARMFADPLVDVVYGDLQYVRREAPLEVVRHWASGQFASSRLSWGWMPPHPTVFLRRRVWDAIGGFDLSYRIAADYEHMLRWMTREGVVVRYLPEVLVRMRLGGLSNRSFKNLVRKSREDLHAMHRHRVGGLATLMAKNLRKLPQFLGR